MRSLGRAHVLKTRTLWTLNYIRQNRPIPRYLPARLHDARNLSLESERTEAETADAEFTKERARTTAELATVVLAGLELRLACVFDALCCC